MRYGAAQNAALLQPAAAASAAAAPVPAAT